MGFKTGDGVKLEYDPPEKLTDFKQLAAAPDQFNIPEIGQKRSSTDRFFIYGFATCFLLLMVSIIYTVQYSDSDRFLIGYDKCGNICGMKNEYVDGIECSGKDMTEKPILKYDSNYVDFDNLGFEERHCSDTCPEGEKKNKVANETVLLIGEIGPDVVIESVEVPAGYFAFAHRCFPNSPNNDKIKNYFKVLNKLIKIWNMETFGKILLLIIVAAVTSMFLFFALKFATAATIWITVVGTDVAMLIFTICILVYLASNDGLTFASVFCLGLIQIFMIVVLVVVVRKIPFIIVVFKESIKAISAMPIIMLIPFYTFINIFIVLVLYHILGIHFASAGILQNVAGDLYDYMPNGFMMFTIAFSLFMMIWLWQFLLGCETMIISGAVATWYFARDKTFLGRPLYDSFLNLMKYHTGSAAFGSLVLTIFEILRLMIKSMARNTYTKIFADFCLGQIKLLVFYISKNAYIQVAMHGEGFFKSGKRAAQLLAHNISDTIYLNFIGDFVLAMAKLTVVLVTIIFGIYTLEITDEFAPFILAIGGLFALILAHCVFKVFETTIDTIFLCYCEDCQLNDGVDRPYYMSQDLQKLFDESKFVLDNNAGHDNGMMAKDISDV